MSPDAGPAPLARLDVGDTRRWIASRRGPPELFLSCRGSLAARAVAALHFNWPFARGHVRLVKLLRAASRLTRAFDAVPFSSRSGVGFSLDMTSTDFIEHSGRLSAEPLELAVMARLVRSGDTFVDVGAHRGLYIPHVLGRIGPAGSYHAVEPSAENAAFIRRTFIDRRLTVHALAVSDFDGTATLVRDGSCEAYISRAAAEARSAVRVARLDTLLAHASDDGAWVCKIDIEGGEASALRGMEGLVARGAKPVALLEYLALVNGQSRGDVDAALAAVLGPDYRFIAIDRDRGTLDEFQLGEPVAASVRNILAVPHAHLARLEAVAGILRLRR